MKHVAIAIIRAYQVAVSPFLPRCCIYEPSCSRYAIEAYRDFGFWRGTQRSVWRLLRCGPWSAGGPDPVR